MKLHLPRDIKARMKAELRRAGAREIGGFIMAEQLEPGTFKVVDFSIDRDSGHASCFHREPTKHRAELQAFFDKTGADFSRFNYLGEWHSHPSFSVEPSSTDINAMFNIVQEQDIDFAVLMIVRLKLQFWLAINCELYLREGRRTKVNILEY
jgi:[CysO sulfur-carrier protein]-S-L-cysteine hydrolase